MAPEFKSRLGAVLYVIGIGAIAGVVLFLELAK